MNNIIYYWFIICFRYANNESYNKAVEDFQSALKFNSEHFNAKKYLVETLYAYANRYKNMHLRVVAWILVVFL